MHRDEHAEWEDSQLLDSYDKNPESFREWSITLPSYIKENATPATRSNTRTPNSNPAIAGDGRVAERA